MKQIFNKQDYSQFHSEENSDYDYDYDVLDSDRTEVSSDLFVDINKQSMTPIRPILKREPINKVNDHKVTLQLLNDSKFNSTDSELLKTACITMEKRLSNLSQIMDRTINAHQSKSILLSDSDSSEEERDDLSDDSKVPEWDDIFTEIKKQKKYLLSFLDTQTKSRIMNHEMIKNAKRDRKNTLSQLHAHNVRTVNSIKSRSPNKFGQTSAPNKTEKRYKRSLIIENQLSTLRSKNGQRKSKTIIFN